MFNILNKRVKVFRFEPLYVWLQHIDKIGFRSSFLSSEVAKLCSVVVHDVRINKDVKGRKHRDEPRPWQPPPSFHDRRIPPIVITFAQVLVSFCQLDLIFSWKKLLYLYLVHKRLYKITLKCKCVWFGPGSRELLGWVG